MFTAEVTAPQQPDRTGAVGNVKNNVPELIERIAVQATLI